jgi:hypothetical protein
MDEILKKLKNGYSTSELYLINDNGNTIVRKINNIERNIARFSELSELDLQFPKIFNITSNSYDMEYIPNLDIKTFITHYDNNILNSFIKKVLSTLKTSTTGTFDFTEIYKQKLDSIDFEKYKFVFDKESLLFKLPKNIPVSQYHGDFTLENILYSTHKNDFILIDPITTEYSSYVFDIAKLRQDLKCKWFIRNEPDLYINSKLKNIDEEISKFNCNNDYLLILMLMRILPYTKS